MQVLITGASRGIGRATAQALAPEHEVAVGYNESESAAETVVDEIQEAGGTAMAVQADVSDSAAVEEMVETTVETLGGLDAVVNNAGIADPARLTELDDDHWQRVIETNLSGAFYVTRAAMEHLQPGGDVVFVSSIGGTAGTVDTSYAASKAGLHGLTRALAREYGEDGVQVNAVAPGPAETDMNDDILAYLESVDFRGHENVDTHLPEYACEPEAVAHTIEYLLENDYVQGEIVDVNGGMQF
ncbi:SDR family NAD(P)-dependent oxidoreductase [Halovenus sp. WSH3]|uniref:SDR family NAD(P)-dependent oxidoreductase n=1 Tax=Halovenus carboxidivorans TaxID=2692199 RepID=A0A6B0T6Q0_9EURY|nr:SDR family NAD(P)-dependent oxidoreductase [Halovenus carboxidivorans]MXR50891.1 SDR family NAD(P)-dependent oxidoreductase [Halovenus carboxidivorans]